MLCELVIDHSIDTHEISCRSVQRNANTCSQPSTILFELGMLPIPGSGKISETLLNPTNYVPMFQ